MPGDREHSFHAFRALDLSAERVWPPARIQLQEGWRCRLDRGVTRRANSVLAVDWKGRDLDSALVGVEDLYRDAGLTPCFQVTAQAQPEDLDDILAARGYAKGGASLVQRCDLEALSATRDPTVTLTETASPVWEAALLASGDPAAGLAKSAILARAEGPAAFVSLGETAVDAIGVGMRDGKAVWVNSMYTAPSCRGRGLARRLLTTIAGWAQEQGVPHLMLQVEEDNPAARRLYEGFGFLSLYPYHYRSHPSAGTGVPGC